VVRDCTLHIMGLVPEQLCHEREGTDTRMLIYEDDLFDAAADEGHMSEARSGIVPRTQFYLTAQTPQARVPLIKHEQVQRKLMMDLVRPRLQIPHGNTLRSTHTASIRFVSSYASRNAPPIFSCWSFFLAVPKPRARALLRS
jgi:hypothetical protein